MKQRSLDNYGGVIANYEDVVDPTRDEDAIFRNLYVTDVGMMTNTACQAIVSFVAQNGANPTDPPSGFVHMATWGGQSAVKPNIVRFAEGVWDITFPTAVNTPLTVEPEELGGGQQETVVFRRADAAVQCSDGVLRHARAEVTGANTVRVRGWTAAGALDDLAGQVITVWIW